MDQVAGIMRFALLGIIVIFFFHVLFTVSRSVRCVEDYRPAGRCLSFGERRRRLRRGACAGTGIICRMSVSIGRNAESTIVLLESFLVRFSCGCRQEGRRVFYFGS